MKHAQILLFIGKGGVGKTTCSVTTAVHLADKGCKVLLVSLDPAHNAGDALDCSLNDQKTSVTPMLDALEIDLETLIQGYLKQTSEMMRHTYRYLTVINLEKFFEMIRYSPGIEEQATLEALKNIIFQEAYHYDVIVFDTAPTGLTLRVLALPSLSMLWTQKLTGLRKKILDLRSSIAHIHGEQYLTVEGVQEKLATSEDDDSTMRELRQYHTEIERIRKTLTNPNLTSVAAVLNAEEMPLLETERAAEALKKFQIPLKLLIVNKVLRFEQTPPEFMRKMQQQEAIIARASQVFPQQTLLQATWQQEEPRGLEKLRQFCPEAAEFFMNLL